MSLAGSANLDLGNDAGIGNGRVPAETQALATRRTDTISSLSRAVMLRSPNGGITGLPKL